MGPVDQTMTAFENDPKRINILEEIDLKKGTISDHMLNIIENNDSSYRIIQCQHQTATDMGGC